MNLYEVTNGYIGESYVRVYAWAASEMQAEEMARAIFKADEEKKHNPRPHVWEQLHVELLFSGDADAFVTNPSDAGWETDELKK